MLCLKKLLHPYLEMFDRNGSEAGPKFRGKVGRYGSQADNDATQKLLELRSIPLHLDTVIY